MNCCLLSCSPLALKYSSCPIQIYTYLQRSYPLQTNLAAVHEEPFHTIV